MKKGSLAFNNDPPVGNLAGMDNDCRPTITIKLKPYLQEFLRCKLQDAEQLTASKRNIIGVLLRPMLEIKKKDEFPVFHRNDKEWITFNLPRYEDEFDVRGNSVTISEKNMKYFEDCLEAYFKDLFFSYMDDKVRYMSDPGKRGGIKKCIIQFCADCDITFNCINYEMLKKSYYRRRLEINKKFYLFSRNLSFKRPLIFLL